jgi:hypothetical protein
MQLPGVNVFIFGCRQDAPEHNRYASRRQGLVEASPTLRGLGRFVLPGASQALIDKCLRSIFRANPHTTVVFLVSQAASQFIRMISHK